MAHVVPTDADKIKYGDIEQLRGRRQVAEITVETYNFRGAVAPDESSHSSDVGEGCSYASVVAGHTLRPVRSPTSDHATSNETSETISTKESKGGRPKSSTPKLPTSLEFTCGNPSVEVVKGILHLYKDSKKINLSDDVNRSEMVCMLSVPATFTIHDLLSFTDHVYEGIEYMKILKDASPNHYMVLVKFKSQDLADEFYINYNNKQYNSIEPDICHLVYVARVDFLKESQGGAVPVPGLSELPSCTVCLERMDESVDGVLTILCNHSFHGRCLANWEDTTCPVCRYNQTPEPTRENFCSECNSTDSLWICLVCGQVGCGRYVYGHAYEHFVRTNHTYAMQLSNGRVWDYVGDNYVHRLVQNKEDGKLVEMDEHGQRVTDEKMDSLTLEYTYLLTSQLESQRQYFESKLLQMERDYNDKMCLKEEQLDSAVTASKTNSRDIDTLRHNKDQLEHKCAQLAAQLKKVYKQLQEEQALNKSLISNQAEWQEQIKHLKEENSAKEMEYNELQEQLNDIMVHLEAQNKLASCSQADKAEIEEGSIQVGAAAASSAGRRQRKKK